jgi:hypothetical protein
MILRDAGAMRPIASNWRCRRDFSSAICPHWTKRRDR